MHSETSVQLWDEIEFCRRLGISRSKARQDRVHGTGCPFIKIGRSVRYDPSSVQLWLVALTRKNTLQIRG